MHAFLSKQPQAPEFCLLKCVATSLLIDRVLMEQVAWGGPDTSPEVHHAIGGLRKLPSAQPYCPRFICLWKLAGLGIAGGLKTKYCHSRPRRCVERTCAAAHRSDIGAKHFAGRLRRFGKHANFGPEEAKKF